MLGLAKSIGRFVVKRFSKCSPEVSENDISTYLYQREEIALRSLQESLRSLKQYQMDAESLKV
jgi:hypothetical protein